MEIFPNLPSLLFHVVFSTRNQDPLITAEIGTLLYNLSSTGSRNARVRRENANTG